MPRHPAIPPDYSIGGAGEDKDNFGVIHIPSFAGKNLAIQAGNMPYFAPCMRFGLAI